MIRAIITDIEGTTTPLAFVHDVLFPYARERLAGFCRTRQSHAEVSAALRAARALEGKPSSTLEETIELLLGWMKEDRKAGPLKELQGFVWQEGYEDGVLKGQVYEDAAAHLRNWRAAGLKLFVYSSGSIQAQKLIFGCSDKGDLTPLFDDFFDTGVGPKVEEASYTEIARRVHIAPEEILFLSDHPGEIAAAKAAGMSVALIDRNLDADHSDTQDGTLVAGSFSPVASIFGLA